MNSNKDIERLHYELYRDYKKDTVFHYTNWIAFKSIMTKQEFWLTQINDFEDNAEIKEGLRCLEKYFSNEQQKIHNFAKIILNNSLPCAISFCKEADYPYMWNTYAKEKNSVCIEVDNSILFNLKHTESKSGRSLMDCIYDKKRKEEVYNNLSLRIEKMKDCYFNNVIYYILLTKEHKFKNECEKRHFYLPTQEELSSENNRKVYKMPFQLDHVYKIWIRQDADENFKAEVETLLKKIYSSLGFAPKICISKLKPQKQEK